MALIFALSAMPSHDPDRGLLVLVLRKLAHFSEYALLTALWWRALRTRFADRRALIAAVVIAIVYAATDELHQTLVEGRVGAVHDVLIDAAGACAAAVMIARRRRAVKA
jgi:VanZ family protein